MNNNYYPSGGFPSDINTPQPALTSIPSIDPTQYSQTLLRRNRGKKATFYLSFSDSVEWRDKVFSGTIEAVGPDFVLIKDGDKFYLLWSIYIDYAEFNETPVY
jgi:spore coat protein GerQ